jgi:glucokinase-like ROK family protein
MGKLFEELKGKLIVSCQASPGDPLEDIEALRRIAAAAVKAGASGLRMNSGAQIAAVRRDTNLPVIGIEKKYGPMGLRITPDFASAAVLAKAGASIIAVDCTDREWTNAEPWREIIKRIHNELKLPVMADISTLDEAVTAAAAGADCVGPTLYGYTEQTRGQRGFSWQLLAQMKQKLGVPIMAEGHISTPEEARRAIADGAWCVIVGSAITRPGVITGNFVRALSQPTAPSLAVGVDIGGTFIKAGLVRASGEVLFSTQTPTEASKGRDAISAGLVRVIDETLAAARTEKLEPSGIGIATAGNIDERDGSIFAATDNLPGWAGFELRAFAEKHFSRPVWVVNDAQAAALSELHFGMGRGLSDFVAITIGTGIGAGIVSAGKLLRGLHGCAGSIGHIVIHTEGRRCNCGRSGCLEAYVSTAALLREYREHGGIVPPSLEGEAALTLHINQLACSGDAAAQAAYAELAKQLSEGIANLFNLLDPQAVILSGGLIESYSAFVPDLGRRIVKLLHFGEKRKPQIRVATSGRFAGVQGAASLALALGDEAL